MENKKLLGKPVAEKIYLSITEKLQKLHLNSIIPKLSVILIGNDPSSKIYVNSKKKAFTRMKCKSEIHHFDENVLEEHVINLVDNLNSDNTVHGILIQLPLPKHLDSEKIIKKINPKKDVDGFHPENLGNLLQGNPTFIPCTPYGCIEVLKYYNINIKSKHVVIVGRSNIVGKPLFALLSQRFKIGNATVTICHSHTKNLSKYTKMADVLIVAVGKSHLITDNMIKDGVIILDVGINRINDTSQKGYYIVGDVDFDRVVNKASAITPVPGGIGPMTIAMLLYNTVKSAENKFI